MISTGKHARKKFGTRIAAKQSKARKGKDRTFGSLKYSVLRKTASAFNAGSE